MTSTIAVAGKGGTGKTTIAGLLIGRLAEAQAADVRPRRRPGEQPQRRARPAAGATVGDIREETTEKARDNMLERAWPSDLLDYEVNASVVEGTGVDLLAMGRPEGAAATAPPTPCCASSSTGSPTATLGDHRQRSRTGASLPAHDARRRRAHHRQRPDACAASPPPVACSALVDELQTRVGRRWLIVNRVAEGLRPK